MLCRIFIFLLYKQKRLGVAERRVVVYRYFRLFFGVVRYASAWCCGILFYTLLLCNACNECIAKGSSSCVFCVAIVGGCAIFNQCAICVGRYVCCAVCSKPMVKL